MEKMTNVPLLKSAMPTFDPNYGVYTLNEEESVYETEVYTEREEDMRLSEIEDEDENIAEEGIQNNENIHDFSAIISEKGRQNLSICNGRSVVKEDMDHSLI